MKMRFSIAVCGVLGLSAFGFANEETDSLALQVELVNIGASVDREVAKSINEATGSAVATGLVSLYRNAIVGFEGERVICLNFHGENTKTATKKKLLAIAGVAESLDGPSVKAKYSEGCPFFDRATIKKD